MTQDGSAGLPRFDASWLAQIQWSGIDQSAELSRWQVCDSAAQRQWLIVRASQQASAWELARLDREYAIGPSLNATWAVIPLARLNTASGTLLVFNDDGGLPLSRLSAAALSVERFLQLAIAATQALALAHHHGIVHGDIRPENLIRDSNDNIRLTGFAFAQARHDTAANMLPLAASSLAYLAPELQGKQESTASAQSDLYALGVTFFQLLTGNLPFNASDPVQWLHQHVAVAPPMASQWRADLPPALDDLLAWLLAKQPEKRPPSADALETELRGLHEASSTPRYWPQSPQQSAGVLVGREQELQMLHEALARLKRGVGGAVMIHGEAGIGKTSLVSQLRRNQHNAHLLFATGKCELSRHPLPYAALATALAALFIRMTGEAPADLMRWGEQLRTAVGENGYLIARLIPELECLTGPLPVGSNPPPVSEARRHLHSTLQQLLEVIATRQHPLVLCLDDVQWIDEETQEFLSELVPSSFAHLLLMVVYRQQEPANKQLNALLTKCRKLGARSVEIPLRPLAVAEIGAMLNSELRLPADEQALLANRLSQLDNGNGNPLYVAQFAVMLRESANLAHSVQFPPLLADVSALMQLRLARLPEHARDALALLTILGNHAPLEDLAAVSDVSLTQLLHLLRPAFKAGLISEYRDGLSFTHDAVWESIRAQLSAQRLATLRLACAATLLARLGTEAEADQVFRVAAQVVCVDEALLDKPQRLAFIELLIRATHLAIVSASATTALDYLAQAQRLLAGINPADAQLHRTIALLLANALILNADYSTADNQLMALLAHTEGPLQQAELYRLKCEICSLRGDYAAAVCTAIDGLAALGVVLAPAPTDEQMQHAWQTLQAALAGRSPKVFSTLPTINDARIAAIVELLAMLVIPGSFIHPHLMLVSTCKIASLTLQHGMSAAAVHALAWLGVTSAHRFDAYASGFEYAATARKLVELPDYASSKVSVLIALDQVSVWTRPLPFALECAESAYRESIAQGSPSFACYANNHIVSNLLVLGAPIERMLRQIDIGLALARNLEFIDAQTILYAQARYIRCLAGDVGGTIAIPDSAELAQRVSRSSMGPLRFWWQLYEGLLGFLDGAFEQAAEHFDSAWALAWSAPAHIHLIDLAMFSVLNLAALQGLTGKPQNVEQPMRLLRLWATLNPVYFADRLALAEAELLCLEGRSLEALQRYEAAIDHAQSCGAIHLQGLAHTLASRCYETLGLQSSQRHHLRKAHEAWCRWGAVALAERLEAQYGFLRERIPAKPQAGALSANQQLDMLSITRACQVLSREIEPDALIKILLANAVTHAGATYAALMLETAGSLCLEATGHTRSGGIDIDLSRNPPSADNVPLSLVLQVKREHQSLLINVAEALRHGNDDPYLTHLESGSIMCLPLLKQNEVIGVLYLENNLTSNAFESSRISVLELLAAQAAISLSTARMYSDLLEENQRRRESECTLRRTQTLLAIGQEVSRYGTFVWRHQTEASFWSPRLIAELGLAMPTSEDYQRDPAMLVHVDDRLRFAQCLEDAGSRREAFRLEFRTVPLDGTQHYLELAGEPDGADALIGVVSDISERRQTEIALHTARTELDRTSQATILGELAASIAHEINQPLASILSNSGASIRWLQRPQPQIDEAIEGIQDILSEGQRAADIIRAMRALAKQSPLERKPLALDQVIRQVLDITYPDLNDKHVLVSLKLSPAALVCGDAIQLQQVMRNLIINALEAMQAQPSSSRRLTLEAQPLGREVVVIVEDSGPGVPADKLGSIFQTFYSTKPSGMGMGLAICASIIASHGGVLDCTQGRQGENLFYFTLPVQPTA
jgi:predicted ATPase/signal transduction histidine kinase